MGKKKGIICQALTVGWGGGGGGGGGATGLPQVTATLTHRLSGELFHCKFFLSKKDSEVPFPRSFGIWHTPTTGTNEETALHFIDKVNSRILH